MRKTNSTERDDIFRGFYLGTSCFVVKPRVYSLDIFDSPFDLYDALIADSYNTDYLSTALY